MPTTLSAKELAVEAKTDQRSMRKFLRSYLPADEQPGQGGRYSFTPKEASKIVAAFLEKGPSTTKAAKPSKEGKKSKKNKGAPAVEETPEPTKKSKKAKAELELPEEIDDVITLEDLEGPTASDLDPDAEEIITLPTAAEKVEVLEPKPRRSRSKKAAAAE